MAANTKYQHFNQPNDTDAAVWRYVDLPKLVDFLVNKRIWLSQIARLDDPFEGCPAPISEQQMLSFLSTSVAEGKFPGNPERCIESTKRMMRRSVYANCWCLQEHESPAMWRMYGGPHGVAIKSTYRRLAEALPDNTLLGVVSYFDPKNEEPQDTVAIGWAMRKHHFYAGESECRVVRMCWQRKAEAPEVVDDDWEAYPPGLEAPIDMEVLQPSIVVSPLAPSWYFDCVRAVASQFNPGTLVSQSAHVVETPTKTA